MSRNIWVMSRTHGVLYSSKSQKLKVIQVFFFPPPSVSYYQHNNHAHMYALGNMLILHIYLTNCIIAGVFCYVLECKS